MPFLDIGDGSIAAPDLVQLTVRNGDTVVVNVLSSSTNSLQVYTNGIDQASTQVNVGSNTSLTTTGPYWIQATTGGGVCNVEITGGMYGAT
jgi:hypothetical protein